jgi:hypothetical protein
MWFENEKRLGDGQRRAAAAEIPEQAEPSEPPRGAPLFRLELIGLSLALAHHLRSFERTSLRIVEAGTFLRQSL